jgi:hypothetical protein
MRGGGEVVDDEPARRGVVDDERHDEPRDEPHDVDDERRDEPRDEPHDVSRHPDARSSRRRATSRVTSLREAD